MFLTSRNNFIHIYWEEYEGSLEEKYNLVSKLILDFSSHKIFGYNYVTCNIASKFMRKYTESEIVDNLVQIIELLNRNKIPWEGIRVKASFKGEFSYITITETNIIFDYLGLESKVINIKY
jgi:hypothetical protein